MTPPNNDPRSENWLCDERCSDRDIWHINIELNGGNCRMAESDEKQEYLICSSSDEGESEEKAMDLSMEKSSSVKLNLKGTKKFGNLKLTDSEIEERRRSANFMERRRMKKLSTTLNDLRKCIPQQYHLYHRRMSKIRTLRLAISYIKALSDMIKKDDEQRRVAMTTYSTFYPAIISGLYSPQRQLFPSVNSNTGFQTPKRQLLLSPSTYPGAPVYDTPGGPHMAYQTPVQSLARFLSPDRRVSHTISSPDDDKNPKDDTGYIVYRNSPEDIGESGVSWISSCRFAKIRGMEGICPLPKDDQKEKE